MYNYLKFIIIFCYSNNDNWPTSANARLTDNIHLDDVNGPLGVDRNRSISWTGQVYIL